MSEGIATLRNAVRPEVVAKHLGQLGLVIAGLTLAPAVAGLIANEIDIALRFVTVAALLALLCVPMARLRIQGQIQANEVARLRIQGQIQANEVLTVSALVYLLAALAGTWPMLGLDLPFADAFFETVSGVTTTGLSTLASVESLPRSILFARAWNQWYGGLGIAVLAVAMLTSYDLSTQRLMEKPPADEHLLTTTLGHARRVTRVYLALTLLGIVGLLMTGLSTCEAVLHVLSAVSTGGFGTHDGNLAGLPSRSAQILINLLALLCAVSLPIYALLFRGQWRRALGDIELKALLVAGGTIVALLLGIAWLTPSESPQPAAIDLALLGISAQTTSGFSTIDPRGLDALSKGLLIAAMSVGGSIGSTAGGIKLLRLIMVMRLLQLLLRRVAMPAHAVIDLTVGGRKVPDGEALRTLMLVLLFPLTAFLSWLPFLAWGYPPLESLFEVVSALGTVGLSCGITGPALPDALKAVLCADMLLGRLEFIAVLILIMPATWIGRRTS
ncbi:MAG: potassium transporter TrkG [Candidatus Thiodiazotropha sp.]